ncbi:MAG: hypothetical protein M1837_005513 [Sclerophora amabilis]|nr:MAG: hypothetical protein M1837_005513 [Sclerophora amabilis]
MKDTANNTLQTPVCDRCHHLLHHHVGVSIDHPSLESIQETIDESPHKYNHIYHVLDAADFPLSLIPDLHRQLAVTPQRSLNRRSKAGKFYRGKKAELSFIINRSDLLAPKKEQVDSLMPYLIQVLREALGPDGLDVRLGNVRCVSSKRGWWTKEVKEDIWRRGGGGWMVGKVNVGKSNLFECVYPKGRTTEVNFEKLRRVASSDLNSGKRLDAIDCDEKQQDDSYQRDQIVPGNRPIPPEQASEEGFELASLLPPPQPEEEFPAMPTISSLPGTTASPIRLSFGSGRGELVDLPGLARGDLEPYVKESNREDLVMRNRVKPNQQVLKPGQSLVVGGLVRLTPCSPNTTFLAYSFLPFGSHVTSTEKAIRIHTQQGESGVDTIARRGSGSCMASAGTFPLKWDVTKARSGPVTSSSAAAIKVDRLPYRIFSTDILIEGCGWIEVVAQVRKKDLNPPAPLSSETESDLESDKPPLSTADPIPFPEVEVFSPGGKHVGSRRPMNAWLMGKPLDKAAGKSKCRPRPSKQGEKKASKRLRMLR